MNNLKRTRPDEWQRGFLFPFIEECWSNSVAVVGNNNVIAARLTAIDALFQETHQGIKPATWIEITPSLLMLRSFSAFRASVMVALSLPSDCYPVQRLCLESAGYAKLMTKTPDLAKVWLRRDENPAEAKSSFTVRAVRDAIATDDEQLAAIYQALYEQSIDFGAHPNEKGVLGSVLAESIGTGVLQFAMLGANEMAVQHALRCCAQAGICSLKVFNLIFGDHFAKYKFDKKVEHVSKPF
jgi:hypothetical protein